MGRWGCFDQMGDGWAVVLCWFFCVSAVCLWMGCEQAMLAASNESICCSHGKM